MIFSPPFKPTVSRECLHNLLEEQKESSMTITEKMQDNTATLKLEGSFTYTQRKLFQDTLKNLGHQECRTYRGRSVAGIVPR